MPVLIAAGPDRIDLARLVARKLRQDSGEVRCYLEDPDHELSDLGCKIAVGSLDDALTLEGALTGVHTFIPLPPDPAVIRDAEDAERIRAGGLAAASASPGVEQLIFPAPSLSSPRGGLGGVFAEVVAELERTRRPLCVIRHGLVWSGALKAVLRSGAERIFPEASTTASVVLPEDLAAVLAAADDHEGLRGTWDLGGHDYLVTDLIARAKQEAMEGSLEGATPVPNPWLEEVIAGGLAVENSACAEFGVEPKRIFET